MEMGKALPGQVKRILMRLVVLGGFFFLGRGAKRWSGKVLGVFVGCWLE